MRMTKKSRLRERREGSNSANKGQKGRMGKKEKDKEGVYWQRKFLIPTMRELNLLGKFVFDQNFANLIARFTTSFLLEINRNELSVNEDDSFCQVM